MTGSAGKPSAAVIISEMVWSSDLLVRFCFSARVFIGANIIIKLART